MEEQSLGESDDQLQRSTEKVKTRIEGGYFSYKDTLMNTSLFDGEESDFNDESFSAEEVHPKFSEPGGEFPRIEASVPFSSSKAGHNDFEIFPEAQQSTSQNPQAPSNIQARDNLFGPWMLVKKPQRHRQIRDNGNDVHGQSLKQGKGSRFEFLNSENHPSPIPPMSKSEMPLGENPQSGPLKKRDPKRDGKSFVSQGTPNKGPNISLNPRVDSSLVRSKSGSAVKTTKLSVDKAEEKGIFALMQQFNKKAKDSYESSKSLLQIESVLPDTETMQFLDKHQRNLWSLPPPQVPPDLGPVVRCTQSSIHTSSEGLSSENMIIDDPCLVAQLSRFGQDTHFRKDRWVPSLEPLQELVECDMIDNSSARVSDYMGDDWNWNLLRLSDALPPDIFAKVQALAPPSFDKGPNLITWGNSYDGSIIVASAYSHLAAISKEKSMNHDIYIKWIPPPQNWFKINLDGAVSHLNKLAGCVGVLRDYLGNFQWAFSAFLVDCSIMFAKLHAILLGIKLAINRKLTKVVFESDSSSAIRFIQFGCDQAHLCSSLVDNIRKLIDSILEVVWSHTWREGNFLANAFANHALRCQDPYVEFGLVPSFSSSVLFADVSGTIYRHDSHNVL
ncbi:Ribonuclease H domain [Sesbania bispinosa]|nr:Ribonuclease H domain [Sesbania bispinosa]